MEFTYRKPTTVAGGLWFRFLYVIPNYMKPVTVVRGFSFGLHASGVWFAYLWFRFVPPAWWFWFWFGLHNSGFGLHAFGLGLAEVIYL